MTQIGSFEYALPPAIAVAVGLSIIVIVAKWAPRSPSRQAFTLMVAGLVIWAVAILGMRLSTDLSLALAWNRGAAAAIMFMFLGFYHFSLEYAGPFRQRTVLTVAYVAVAAFAIASPFGLLVEDLRIAEYGYAPVPGFLAIPASGTALALLLAGVYVLLRRYRITSSYEEKNRLLYLVVGASLPLMGTLIDIFTNLPPVGIWTSILFCTVTGVALLEYRLLDIPHVARRTLTYLLLGIMIALPYVGVVFLLQRYVGARLDSFLGYVISILILALLLRPLYSAAKELVDRLFFRERFDALRALERFGLEAHHSVDLSDLSYRLTRLVTDALHSSCTCLFLPSDDRNSFELFHCEGLEGQLQTPSLSRDSSLLRWLESHQEILACRSLDIEPRLQGLPNRERVLLDAIGARLMVPIVSPRGGPLAGLLVLGPKGATGDYSGEDQRLLDALGTQMAISLENARLYSDALRARRDLERWLDGMDDSVVIFGHDRRIRFTNKSARDTLHLRPGDPCDKVLGTNGCRDDCDAVRCPQTANRTLRLPTNAGERQYDVVTAQMTDPDGRSSMLSVLRDVTERKRFEEELRRSRERMRELAAHLESAREQERAGIARELHDELGQLLTALKMDLTWFSRHEQEMPEGAHSRVSGMMEIIDTTIQTVQRISSELRPGILDDLGLPAALEWLAKGFQQKSGIPCDIDLDESLELESSASTALFRICQESLTNVARHSEASRAKVSLKREGPTVALTISDNGRGVTAEDTERTTSFGFIGMRERARGLGGQLTVTGSRGKGTTITVSLPLQH